MKLAQLLTGNDLDSINPTPFDNLGDVVSTFVLYFFPIAGLALLLYLLYGGYLVMLSRGDPKSVEGGKQVITNALIGFAIVFVAFWVVQAIGIALGLDVIFDDIFAP